jgi:hypothetical protein
MRKLLKIVAIGSLLLLVPAAPTSADLCNAIVHVNPDTAPHGTVFRVKTPWADESRTLTFYRHGAVVKTVELAAGDHRYLLATSKSSTGRWRVENRVSGPCHSKKVLFTVT